MKLISNFNDILTIIPARKGSKRLKDKNKLFFENEPLWLHAVNTAKRAGLRTIVVSTDDSSILSESIDDVIMLKRSDQNSTDDATIDSVVDECIEKIKLYDHICLIQPTSPCLHHNTLSHVIHAYFRNKFPCTIAVNKYTMKPCGAFYIFSKQEFLKNHTLWIDGLGIYYLNPEEAIDIDFNYDYLIAQSVRKELICR